MSDAAFEPLITVPAIDEVGDLASDGSRGAESMEQLDEVRHMTLADVDGALAHARARAGLPDDAGIEEVLDFLRRLSAGEVGDDASQRACGLLVGELRETTAPFQDVLLSRGLELENLTLDDLRSLLAAEAEVARDAGDLDLAAELQGALVGFDAVIHQNTVDFLDRFPDLAEADALRDLPVTLPPPLPSGRPASTPLSAGLDPLDVALELEDVRNGYLEQFVPLDPHLDADLPGEAIRQRNNVIQAQTDLFDLALDEVRRGNDPNAVLDAEVKQARLRYRNGAARFPGEADALEEAAETVRLLTEDAATGNLLKGSDVHTTLRNLDEAAGQTSPWPWLVEQDALADALRGEMQRHADLVADSAGTSLANEAEVIQAQQDYLSAYDRAIKDIERGQNPLGYMDEQRRLAEYQLRRTEQTVQQAADGASSNWREAASQQARLDRLQDARDWVYRAMQT